MINRRMPASPGAWIALLPAGGIRVIDGAAPALPSAQANVRIYLVQSSTPSPQTP